MLNIEPAVPNDVLAAETDRLLDFGRAFPHPQGGAAWLDATGQPDLSRPVFTWITARMTHVYCLGHLLGRPGDGDLAAQGLDGLVSRLRDTEDGGWFTSLDAARVSRRTRRPATPTPSWCSPHASARIAALPGADDLLEESLTALAGEVLRSRLRPVRRRLGPRVRPAESLPRREQQHARRRGAAGRSGRDRRRNAPRPGPGRRPAGRAGVRPSRRAGGSRSISTRSGGRCWITTSTGPTTRSSRTARRLGTAWNGPGCCCTWRRRWPIRHLTGCWPSSVALFERAAADGWAVDGADGFVYTTDWDGRPVVRDRMHWVLAEGFAAASALHQRTGEQRYAERARTWWAYAERVPDRPRPRLVAPPAGRPEPGHRHRLARQARPVPRGPGDPAPSAAAPAELGGGARGRPAGELRCALSVPHAFCALGLSMGGVMAFDGLRPHALMCPGLVEGRSHSLDGLRPILV